MNSTRTLLTAGHFRFLLVALPLLLAVGADARPIDVQCGDVLDIDHGQYRLNGDLECPANPLLATVIITGEGVHFNLAGYTITRGDDTDASVLTGIVVRGANAHINNGSIVDFNCPDVDPVPFGRNCAGIFLAEAPGARINGMSLHNNTVGIISFSFGPFGIVGNADGARIHGNDITRNLRAGIVLSGFGGATAEGAKITDNDLSDTGGFSSGGYGYAGTSDGVSLIGNVANNCALQGILLLGEEAEGYAERYTIRDNTTLNNGGTGILLFGATEEFRPRDNLIQDNTAFGNGFGDLGELPFGDCVNTWKDNDFDVAAPDCIE